MNYQKIPEKIHQILKTKNIEYLDVDYYAWPQNFPTTAGPNGGIGGCAMTSFTVEAYVCDGYGPTVYVCGNMISFSDDKFEFNKNICNWRKL